MQIRDYIENMFIGRFNRILPTERYVSDAEYNYYYNQVKPISENLARSANLIGFTTNDIEGLFCMQIHYLLRRNKLNVKNPIGYIVSSHKTLIKEINFLIQKKLKNGGTIDMLDNCVFFWHFNGIDIIKGKNENKNY